MRWEESARHDRRGTLGDATHDVDEWMSMQDVGTHEYRGVEDGLGDAGELDGRHGEFPVPVLDAGPEGQCDDLVAKADSWRGG